MASKKKKSELTIEDLTCSFCTKVSRVPLSVCKGCNRTRYCNINCQRNHWKAGHRQQCKSVSDEAKLIQEVIKSASMTTDEKLASAAKSLLTEESDTNLNTTEDVDIPVDETGIDKNHLNTLTTFTGCSKSLAVKALRSKNNDLVFAIMAVTPGYKNQIEV